MIGYEVHAGINPTLELAMGLLADVNMHLLALHGLQPQHGSKVFTEKDQCGLVRWGMRD